ncbi:LPS export ABC transporter ATP-binding protein [Alkalilimnicola sp. S0819]|uniref:LPS export ABC transporter ATP-binding protein n=1 Tax=Alkalilimnicola sp. S0819 TaxID=2613922 RepID=UPI0012621AF7|nr:LPS export ABC transporter ATP-binding protein [Alkalilimnicola sp. S0819]KAB7623822.1 LPS export ABC transporter ATP-binding protein [Alkalilimnicola sp. S0819]MPQ16697.1 LPS export ABC transporter ATP-binding protein [Alkalilimnicola sp. S0819]
MSRLLAEGLIKRYKGRTVVKDASFALQSGEIVGLLGPNGAGKTTSFYMIVGLIAADGGRIVLDGQDITRLPIHTRARLGIGYLPQEASVFRKLSVANNLMAVLETRKELSRAQRRQELDALLEEFHVTHLRDQMGISLSGGERRRVEIARALAANPRFILLDEPFAGVDPISVVDIQQIVRHLAERGIGVLITDHNVRETLGIVQRAYILGDGAVIAEGSAEEVLANQRVKEVYLGEHFRL